MTGREGKQAYPVARVGDFGEADRLVVQVKNVEIGLFKVGNDYYAWRNLCPHAAAPICAGTVCGTMLPSGVYEHEFGREGEIVRCPWHNWEFDLRTGELLADPSVKLRGFELVREGEELHLLL
ncbi:Rieske 2Fe-2S domain-containing protein [Paenibacillus sp. IB182496]|uniref:Rieske 2Fe-2S domain-containing protein n=1 Tax=Paenibacillus sabuli TaxID=2772509 RepID=A0A927BP17_9BACL|nr:Rieske 2Fe-2S domain-containing protein [Paenibacillus sabuli]MBD2844093.1 Rieske 2Fe-2S domain-containing protein [Paenibacillus sabuli]